MSAKTKKNIEKNMSPNLSNNKNPIIKLNEKVIKRSMLNRDLPNTKGIKMFKVYFFMNI